MGFEGDRTKAGVERSAGLSRLQAMTSRIHTALIAPAPLALLSACADRAPADVEPETAEPVTVAGASEPAAPPAVPGREPSGTLVPQTMQLAEWRAADLDGELACSFSRSAGESPLLVATSFVDDTAISEVALKLSGQVLTLETRSRGGFDALVAGGRFVGPESLTVNIARSAEEPVAEEPRIAMESPRYPAMMVLSRDGQKLSVDGIWECGP